MRPPHPVQRFVAPLHQRPKWKWPHASTTPSAAFFAPIGSSICGPSFISFHFIPQRRGPEHRATARAAPARPPARGPLRSQPPLRSRGRAAGPTPSREGSFTPVVGRPRHHRGQRRPGLAASATPPRPAPQRAKREGRRSGRRGARGGAEFAPPPPRPLAARGRTAARRPRERSKEEKKKGGTRHQALGSQMAWGKTAATDAQSYAAALGPWARQPRPALKRTRANRSQIPTGSSATSGGEIA